MANDVTDALYAALCAMKIASGLPRVDAEYDFGPAIASVEAALAARPLPEGMETTEKERIAHAKAAETEFVWPEAGFVERLLRDFDRLSAENASLKARLAEVEAEKAETRKILVRCHDRIHALPRTSDTDLAIAIERLLGRIARGGRHEG